VVTAKTSRPWHAIPPTAASSDELFGPFSEAAVGFVLIRFYHWIEHTSSQSGQGVWLRDLGSKLGALCEKEFVHESVIDAG
jgi:hypothetical protein